MRVSLPGLSQISCRTKHLSETAGMELTRRRVGIILLSVGVLYPILFEQGSRVPSMQNAAQETLKIVSILACIFFGIALILIPKSTQKPKK
jgi:hypothetical protein